MSKIGVIINTNDPETCWNAMRFGLTGLLDGHEVKIFLMGAGVEMESISQPEYSVTSLIEDFKDNGGIFLICGTCQDSRGLESKLCPANVMGDAVNLVAECDKVLVFG